VKEILVLRHAKSSWSDSGLSDHERPLKKRGLRDAPRIGELLAEQDLVPDVILCSTAVRARQTAERVRASCGREVPLHFTKELYLAGPGRYLDLLAELPDATRRAMVVGHNPGLEELVTVLTEEEQTLPTAALAWIQLAVETWSELAPDTRGQLVRLWRPREL
jgi:phosphohistidine phosphatase